MRERVIHRDCFVVSRPLSEVRHVGRLKLGSKPAQLYVRLSILPLSPQANNVGSGIIKHCLVAFVCLHFCLAGYQRLFEDFCIMGVAAENPSSEWDCFVVSQLFSEARHAGRPWCNGYRRRKWTRRHEFKSWTRLIAFHIALIPLGKVWI